MTLKLWYMLCTQLLANPMRWQCLIFHQLCQLKYLKNYWMDCTELFSMCGRRARSLKWLWWSTDCSSFLMTKYLQNYWHFPSAARCVLMLIGKLSWSLVVNMTDIVILLRILIIYLPNSSVCIITVSMFKAQSTAAGWNYSLSASIVRQQTVYGIYNMYFHISYITVWLTSDFIHAAIWIIDCHSSRCEFSWLLHFLELFI